MIKMNLRVLSCSLLASLGISLFAWCWFVLDEFAIADPWTTLPKGLVRTFDHPSLVPIALKSLALGFVPIGVALYCLGDWTGSGERVLRGPRLVTAKELAKRTRIRRRKGQPPVQVEVAGVPIPLACETGHLLLVGSTGVGKTTAIEELLWYALSRSDRCIIVDPNGRAWSRFNLPGDVLLNPFDPKSAAWNLFAEIKQHYDYDLLAKSVVPDSLDPGAQQWHGYARQLLSEILRMMVFAEKTMTTMERLRYWVSQAPAEELKAFLAGSAANGLFEPNAEKALASTRFVLSSHISSYQYLRAGEFGLRDWLAKGHGNLYITWREDMRASLKPLISSWLDILLASALTLPTENPCPLWLLLDELASLEKLTSLQDALTKGRKHGVRVVAGLQSLAQLEAIYGRDNATTLLSCFRNLVALGGSNSDPETAEVISKGLGQVEVERIQATYSQSQNGNTICRSRQRSLEYLVLPSELMSLPPLHGYLALAGEYPVARIKLTVDQERG